MIVRCRFPGTHLVLSPITLEMEPKLIERSINVLVRYILSVNPYSPAANHSAPSCCFVFSPLMNNQRRSCYCTYEIHLLPAARGVMLLQENQCPSCCSLELDRVYTASALIILLLTLLSGSVAGEV